LPRKVQDLKHLQDQVSELLSKSAASSGPLSGETLGLQMFKKLIDGKMTEALEKTGKWPPHIVPATPAPEPEFLVRLRKRLDADISALDKNRQVMSSPDIAKAQNQILAQRTTLEAEALKFQTNDHARCALEEKRQYDAQYAEAYRLACEQQ
jgi:hypothetical protein